MVTELPGIFGSCTGHRKSFFWCRMTSDNTEGVEDSKRFSIRDTVKQ